MLSNLIEQLFYDPKAPMIFNSGFFLWFFAFVYLIFWALVRNEKNFYATKDIILNTTKSFLTENNRPKIIYLTLVSFYFYYKSSGLFFWILILSTLMDYFLAHAIAREDDEKRRKLWLILSIITNLGLLFYFKYTNFFFQDILNPLAGSHIPVYNIFLPVGISFYTFQSLSYTFDVYKKELKPLDNILDYAFFVSFFPQLVAGPIVRAIDFLPQIHRPTFVSKADFSRALGLILSGLLKKAVIADYISINFIDRIFETPLLYTGLENLMTVYAYAIQIYCDFSGYSDMAIGFALLLGFHFNINFDSPYQSTSITEFWRRWHISLSSWLRDYLYIPLGGNRSASLMSWLIPSCFLLISLVMTGYYKNVFVAISIGSVAFIVAFLYSTRPKFRTELYTYLNLISTMLLGGLWHGASARFVVWGALHGFALALDKFFSNRLPFASNTLTRLVGWFITFHFVCFCWIFFRAPDMTIALQVINQIWHAFHPEIISDFLIGYKKTIGLLLLAYLLHFLPSKLEITLQNTIGEWGLLLQSASIILIIWIIVQLQSAEIQPFIYFQF